MFNKGNILMLRRSAVFIQQKIIAEVKGDARRLSTSTTTRLFSALAVKTYPSISHRGVYPNPMLNNASYQAIRAVLNNDNENLQHWLMNGANPNIQDCDGFTMLSSAVDNGNTEAVSMLLAAGASIEFDEQKYESLLMINVRRGNLEITKLLVDAGCDVNRIDIFGKSVLSMAESHGRVDIALFLQSKGAVREPKKQDNSWGYIDHEDRLSLRL